MDHWRRYGIYYAPPADSALARFGAQWLGWDAGAGLPCPHTQLSGLPVADLTATPRKYGFHGTLKPPFALADGQTPDALMAAVAALAARHRRFAVPLAVNRLGGFVALTPSRSCPPLDALAADCVTELDAFRASPGAAELARRRASGLSDRQEALLARWGYPFVLEEFRFHLTLTGRLAPDMAATVEAALREHLAPLLAAPVEVCDLCVFGEDGTGAFHVVRRFALAPAAP